MRIFGLDINIPRTKEPRMPPITYRTVEVGGLNIFYREAGRADAPTLLLLVATVVT
jgi:hypothetical protein